MSRSKIIVAHPGRQHSFRLASALKKNDVLLYYVTTIYDKDSSVVMKIVKRFLSKDNLKRANGRKNPDLDDRDVKQYCLLGGLIEALLARIDKRHRIYWVVQRIDSDLFGNKVAKLAIKSGADAVIMYDTNATACFRYLRKRAPHILRIQDVSICTRQYMKTIYGKEITESGNKDLFENTTYLWNDDEMARLQQEIDDTQYFLAASHFVRDSLLYCGVNEKQIKIVPYGANVSSEEKKYDLSIKRPLHLLFVGQVVYRKGIVNLLESMKEFDVNDVSLTITGAYNSNSWFVKKYKDCDNVTFTGLVTFDKMKKIYESADVFVLPSFAEGMAQVGIEAMACGLPIICSYNSGVADIVNEGIDGFIIEAGNTQCIVDRIQWFLDHKDKIEEMGKHAHNNAMNYSWQQYEKNVNAAIKSIVKDASDK